METIKNFKNTLFIDIEAASEYADLSLNSENKIDLWGKKAKNILNSNNQTSSELYFDRAALFPEFGKIIVIGMGFLFMNSRGELALKVKTIANDDEKELLKEFILFVNKTYRSRELTLVAHNGKEFDFPYLCRRMLVNGLEIPKSLQLQGKKPWEIIHQDTMEMWRFGDRRTYCSLELLAELLGIPGAKTDLSGDRVNHVFYIEKDLARITAYCLEDVIVVAQLYLRFHFMNLVDTINIQKTN